MNKRTAHRSHPVLALLLAALAAMILLGAHAGSVGSALAIGTYGAFGTGGTRLLVGTLLALAFILATPPGTRLRILGGLYRAAVILLAHFVGGLVFIVVQMFVGMSVVLKQYKQAKPVLIGAPVRRQLAPMPQVAQTLPVVPAPLGNVCIALKHLGYTKSEYAPIVAKMDPSVGFEMNVKSALKMLQVN